MKLKKAEKEQINEEIEKNIDNKDTKKEKISIENKLKKDKESKQIPQESLKDIFKNIIFAIGVIIYFAILNFVYPRVEQELILNIVEICSGILLLAALVLLEMAYKKDSGKFTIIAIEFLVLAFHSLSIKHVITKYDYQFQVYLLTSSYVISIYYILKAIIIYTKGRKKYLDNLSDIPEILKKDEPVKKEAKKRNEIEEKKVVEYKPKSIKTGRKKKKVVLEKESEIKNAEPKKTTKKAKTKKEDKIDNSIDKKDKNEKVVKKTKTKNTEVDDKEIKDNIEDAKKKTTTRKSKKTTTKKDDVEKEDKVNKKEVKPKDTEKQEKKKSVKTKKKSSEKEE